MSTHHRRAGSKSGSGTKASWTDPDVRARRIESMRTAAIANRDRGGPPVDTVTQTHAALPVRVGDIPRDWVEMELFGGATCR